MTGFREYHENVLKKKKKRVNCLTCMGLGDTLSQLEQFVWILDHV